MFQLRFDLRVPGFAETTHAQQYKAALDMVSWADTRGFSGIVVSEHHGLEDGYLSSPVTLASAMLALTSKLTCSISALLVPYHDPLRLAEDIACVDLISGGNRIICIVGLGYRPEEFAMFGRDRTRRGLLAEEGVAAMLLAWTGEPFEYQGRTVRVTPKPLTQPHPFVMMGGSAEISARRAARLGLGFMPPVGDKELAKIYYAEAERLGFEQPFALLPRGPGMVLVSEDPDRTWSQIGPNCLYDAQSYASWQSPDQRSSWHVEADDLDALRASGQYRVVTPDQCVELASEFPSVVVHPLVGGIDPRIGWECLELVASKVIPRLNPQT
ncbi:MAG: LLM class flavin-dependent oxidoreductase [Acidimicrobiales bacterium]